MRTVLGWVFKAAFAGGVYLVLTSGVQIKLPETVLGYKVPEQAQQWVDRTAQMTQFADFNKQTQAGFKGISDALK